MEPRSDGVESNDVEMCDAISGQDSDSENFTIPDVQMTDEMETTDEIGTVSGQDRNGNRDEAHDVVMSDDILMSDEVEMASTMGDTKPQRGKLTCMERRLGQVYATPE